MAAEVQTALWRITSLILSADFFVLNYNVYYLHFIIAKHNLDFTRLLHSTVLTATALVDGEKGNLTPC